MCTLENKQQTLKMKLYFPTQTCCGYGLLVTFEQILGALDISLALVWRL